MSTARTLTPLFSESAPQPPPPTFSVVAPVHDEEGGLPELYRRVRGVLNATQEPWELILVDDGSRDASASVIRALAANDPRVRLVKLSRNFGFQAAVSAGIDAARGRAVILMDADLQDPPEVISAFIEQWRAGTDVVYGVRAARRGETLFKRVTASVFYRVLARLTSVGIPVDTGDFRLMDRRVVDALRRMPERHRFLRGMVSWVGFSQAGVTYERAPRFAGSTKFTLSKMWRFAVDALTAFSHAPLQLASLLGFGIAALSVLGIVVILALRLGGLSTVLFGQAATIVSVLFIGAVQLICLGIFGEYLGRIHDEVKARPLYLVDEGEKTA